MSGAIITAVARGESWDSESTVKIAVAWGQDGATSFAYDDDALDLGKLDDDCWKDIIAFIRELISIYYISPRYIGSAVQGHLACGCPNLQP